jgi:hypothetical protein
VHVVQEQHRTIAPPSHPGSTIVPPADELLNRVMIIMARFITWALVSLIVIATVASLLEKPLMSVVAPVYAEDRHGSAASFGAMLGAFGAGDLVATLAFSVVEHQLPRRLTFLAWLLAPVVMFGARR